MQTGYATPHTTPPPHVWMFGERGGGQGSYSGGQEKDWRGRRESHLQEQTQKGTTHNTRHMTRHTPQ